MPRVELCRSSPDYDRTWQRLPLERPGLIEVRRQPDTPSPKGRQPEAPPGPNTWSRTSLTPNSREPEVFRPQPR
ncbi:hypothetical protein GCM10009533_10970 [Saccharopolyspora spinosporotrichia]|uniref:Uncharacterized protein n=1 Tax=Saccharopolyspora erythraea TaxID=1836 RepID=A0ABN1C8A2_SACER